MVNCYRAGDGRGFWLLGLEQDRHWPGLLAALERPDLGADPRYGTASGRASTGEAPVATLDEEFAHRSVGLAERFDAHDVWWAPINTVAEVIEDPQAIAAGVRRHAAGRRRAAHRAVATPTTSARTPSTSAKVRLGQHTAEVLAGSHSEGQIADLRHG